MTLLVGDCRALMADMPEASVDAIVTDPPYGLSFMGKDWDRAVPVPEYWREALRVAKPGAHLLAFGGTRVWHRLAVAIEDAGWEVRDTIMWLHGQGFPKAKSCLKPAWEPILLARKPGAIEQLQIDACRIEYANDADREQAIVPQPDFHSSPGRSTMLDANRRNGAMFTPSTGRWPANLVLDEEAAAALDAQSGNLGKSSSGPRPAARRGPGFGHDGSAPGAVGFGDTGGASRFFYCAKASKAERNLGGVDNRHPTVKPLALMRWLVRLVTPPGGLVLDPFTGSGTTGIAATLEGFRFVGCELDETHADVARQRIAAASEQVRAA